MLHCENINIQMYTVHMHIYMNMTLYVNLKYI